MRPFNSVAVTLALLVVGAAGAGAHTVLDRADPPVGGTVRTPPASVQLWFTEALEPAFSKIRVVNQSGRQVDKKDSQVDPSNPALLRISLPSLPAGRYKVIWRVLSVDAHITEGNFTFDVRP